MPKHAFEFLYNNVTGILKNGKADNSAIFWYIELEFATGAHLENVLEMFSAFFEKKTNLLEIFSKTFFFDNIFGTYFHFWKFLSPRSQFCSSINSASHHAKKLVLAKKNCAQDNDFRRTLFYIRIDRTWRHSVIFGRLMIGTKFFRMCLMKNLSQDV